MMMGKLSPDRWPPAWARWLHAFVSSKLCIGVVTAVKRNLVAIRHADDATGAAATLARTLVGLALA